MIGAESISWQSFWRTRSLRWSGAVVISLLLLQALLLPFFFSWIGAREGSVLDDLLLGMVASRDRSLPMFALLYSMLVCTVFLLRMQPLVLLRTLLAYSLVIWLRMISMVLVPLEPPLGLVPLIDPISQLFYPGAEPFQKDLFFSGHLATAVLLALPLQGRWKWILMGGSVLISIFLVQQHVHYTVDLVVAPFAAILAWKTAGVVLSHVLAAGRFPRQV
jgi:hypothetical protein